MTECRPEEDGRAPILESGPGEKRQPSIGNDSAGFYAALEEKFRGPREDIAKRQAVYLPVLEKAQVLRSDAPVLDIGCGRGEWLELVGKHGCHARGVDLNEKFVRACQEKGLDIAHAEACEFLRSQDAGTYATVTAFHLAEHLPFAQLRELITEIHRVLRPGGIMIIETPNPENIFVGACTFYLDPTHLAPIPPGLLQFLTEQAGFPLAHIARVNATCAGVPLAYLPPEASHSLQINAAINLLNQGFYTSPDYAIVAQKAGGICRIDESIELNQLCEPEFVDIAQFRLMEAEAKTQQAEVKTQQAEAKAQQAEAKTQQAEAKTQQAEAKTQQAEAKLAHSRSTLAQTEDRLRACDIELGEVYRSRSWRMTAPLRKANLLFKQFKRMTGDGLSTITSLPRRVARRVLLSALVHVLFRPERKAKVARLMARFPTLNAHLRAFSRDNRKQAIVLSSNKHSVAGVPAAAPLSGESFPPGMYFRSAFSSPPLFPLKAGRRVIYYYVDHTILCPVNTGMQRVTRRLGRALLEQGAQICFVKWDAHHHQLALLNQKEVTYLSQWNGPVFSPAVLENYPLPEAQPVYASKRAAEEGHWLVVPEVTHITYHPQPVTLDIIMAAKRLGLKTAFIYYDAIPLRRPELAAMAHSHATYMQQLLLANLAVPISNCSARDLVSFFHTHEGAILTPTPTVASIALPGESQLATRVTEPLSSGGTEKLILSVGSIEPRKNQVALVNAFEKFCADHPDNDWRLALVGNLHPDVAQDITRAVKRNSRISYMEHNPDNELDALYRSCAFTAFPSVDEGFGLPILESLWYAKPCICADFGAMAEVAEGGGCLTVNVRETEELVSAITRMTMEPGLLERLSHEAASRPISTWADYAKRIIDRIDHESDPIHQLGVIYYWVDHTCTYPANSGIQRVVRGLARALLEIGIKLVPAKWDEVGGQLYAPTGEELQHLARWNGPHPSQWSPWVDPSQSSVSNWILIPELTTYLARTNPAALKRYASANKLRCAWIFYDAIPWKMKEIYPPEATIAHRRYMEGLNEFEQVFAISEHSRADLISFLAASRMRTPNLDERVRACVLPGEFLEASQVTEFKTECGSVTKILCVCTIEPRKNHLVLLEAFAQIIGQTKRSLALCLVGDSPFPELAEQVNHFINTVPGIHWERNIDDTRLRELYAECDFTVFPSLEEGFGLPILESLWNAKPCICRNSGAMAEVAQGGGCLAVETADSTALAQAILRLAEDDELRIRLARETTTRSFKSWRDYAHEVAARMATERHIPLPRPLPEPSGEADFYGQFINVRPRPLLSICITTYNRAEWLALNLKNLARLVPNPRPEIEIVVCDNTSTDRTPDVVKPYLHRTDFRYYRNPENVGMLGNLNITAHHASGQYIWMLGDDDLLKPDSIERVLRVIQAHPGIALVYLNYSYTRQDDAKGVTKLDRFLNQSIPVVAPGPDIFGPVHSISTKSENFFTAIYCLVFRRDHALRAYSQNTDGRPFSNMLTCIPTTYYVLNFMMNEPAYWVGEPQLVVNMNVSWMKYAPLWILERIPEVYDLAERMGADPLAVDHWRIHNLPSVLHFFKEIFENDQELNIDFFSAPRFLNRIKHLDEFGNMVPILRDIYNEAHIHGRAGAAVPPSQVFAAFQNQ